MKLKTFSMMALSLLIGGAMLAGDAKGRTEGAAVTADLEVMAQAFEDQDGRKPIAGGSTIFDKSEVWLRFVVVNRGLGNAGRFTYKAVIYQNGVKTANPAAETIALESQQSKTLPLVKLNISGRGEQISARLIADIGNFVKETDEANNKMEMSFQVANNF